MKGVKPVFMKNFASAAWRIFDKVMRAVFEALLRTAGKSVTDEQWAGIMQFIKFGLVGAMNTLVYYITYLIALVLFKHFNWLGEKDYLIAHYIGFIVSFFNMFYWNNKYVFKKKEDEALSPTASLIKLFLSYSVTEMLIKPRLMFVLIYKLTFSKSLAPIPIMLITIPLNFLLSKLWAFRGKRKN